MKTGDKVRFLRTTGEGIVKKINTDGTADVEIEDGFTVPALRSDLVVVASEENASFTRTGPEGKAGSQEPIKESRVISADEGIFLAFVPFNDRIASLELVNNTPSTLLYSLFEEEPDGTDYLSYGTLLPFSVEKTTEKSIPELNEWPDLVLQAIFAGFGTPKITENKIRFNPATFFRSKKLVPLVNKEGYLFKIKGEEIKVDTEALKDRFTEGRKETIFKPVRGSREVDLHIEKIAKNHEQMSKAEMLQLQIETFEKALDNAVANGMAEITIIHGVGNGSLRDKIHKALSGNPVIDFYKDAQKERFGYGATYVKLK